MSERPKNRFAYATLIDLGFDPANPEILLELGMERPVDWDAADEAGAVICKRLDFVLTVAHVEAAGEPVGIHVTYDRVVRDYGPYGHLYVYVLALRPTRDRQGRDCDRIALETVVGEAQRLRGRSWCADIGEIRIAWRHAPADVIRLENGSYEPETGGGEKPTATDDEIARMCADFDAFCDDLDPASSDGISLGDEDIEEVLELAPYESRRRPPPPPGAAARCGDPAFL